MGRLKHEKGYVYINSDVSATKYTKYFDENIKKKEKKWKN